MGKRHSLAYSHSNPPSPDRASFEQEPAPAQQPLMSFQPPIFKILYKLLCPSYKQATPQLPNLAYLFIYLFIHLAEIIAPIDLLKWQLLP